MSTMRWAVGCVAAVALAVGCSSQLAPLRAASGTDAAVDHVVGTGAPMAVDAASDVGRGLPVVDAARDVGRGLPVVDAAPDFVGRPDPALPGLACRKAIDCITDYCVDGVCCNTACTGPCVTCSAPGAVGTCLPVDLGAPARVGQCPADSPATCGRTGACDGVGGCQLYPAETLCVSGACVDGTTVRVASTCDGFGTCQPGPIQSCAPYTCRGGACYADDCQLSPADCLSLGNRDASSD
jgi:hypothetical protein